MHVPLGSKLPKSCALTTESQSPSCAKAGQSGYFLFVSIFTLQPSVSLACFFCCCFLICCVCFFSKQENRAYPRIFCQLPIQLLFAQGSCEPDRGLDIGTFVLLRAPGPALTRLPGKWRGKCPRMHPSWLSADSTHRPSGLLSLLCTQLGLGSGNFLQDSALPPLHTLFCKPGCMEKVETTGWCVILCCRPHIEIGAQRIKDSTWQGSSGIWVCILKTVTIQAYGEC